VQAYFNESNKLDGSITQIGNLNSRLHLRDRRLITLPKHVDYCNWWIEYNNSTLGKKRDKGKGATQVISETLHHPSHSRLQDSE